MISLHLLLLVWVFSTPITAILSDGSARRANEPVGNPGRNLKLRKHTKQQFFNLNTTELV
jgi:hypothetical protein